MGCAIFLEKIFQIIAFQCGITPFTYGAMVPGKKLWKEVGIYSATVPFVF